MRDLKSRDSMNPERTWHLLIINNNFIYVSEYFSTAVLIGAQGALTSNKQIEIWQIEICLPLFLPLLYACVQPRPQGLLAFQNGGGSGEDPGTQQITCLQRGWRCIQNGGYREKGEKNCVRDAKVKINKMAEKAEVQFKKK